MRKFKYTACAAAIGAAVFTVPAQAEAWEFNFNPGPRYDAPDSGNYVKLRGRAYFDIADIDWSSPFSSAPDDGEEFRTARFGFEARYDDLLFCIEYDFSGENAKPKDVNLLWSTDLGTLRIGHFKTMNSMEDWTSSRYITFMERGMFTDLFGIDRRVGVAFFHATDDYTLSAGVYGGRMDDNFAFRTVDDSSAVAARFTWNTVTEDETRYHLGGSFRYMDYGGDGNRFRVRPGAHLSNRFAAADYRAGSSLGEAESSNLIALEAAMIRGPLHVHGEYGRLAIDGPAGDPVFNGGFINAGYFLTGESRRYKTSTGGFNRTSPAASVTEGGRGAWEVAARYDFAEMEDAGLGTMSSWTLGVNWYVHKHVRVMANIVDAEHDGPGFTEEGDAVQFRFQVDF